MIQSLIILFVVEENIYFRSDKMHQYQLHFNIRFFIFGQILTQSSFLYTINILIRNYEYLWHSHIILISSNHTSMSYSTCTYISKCLYSPIQFGRIVFIYTFLYFSQKYINSWQCCIMLRISECNFIHFTKSL